jgi:hypothetical protein
MTLTDTLADGARELGLELTEEQAGRLIAHLDLLDDWNTRMNLTAIRERGQQVTKHILDSLSVRPFLRGERYGPVDAEPWLEVLGETGVVPVLNQIELHPRLQQADLRAFHAAHGIVTQSWTPLGQGKSFAAAPVAAAAARSGKSPAQVILRWHVQLGCSVIPRSTRAVGLAENLNIFDFTLTEAEMAAIATLDAGERTGPDPAKFN